MTHCSHVITIYSSSFHSQFIIAFSYQSSLYKYSEFSYLVEIKLKLSILTSFIRDFLTDYETCLLNEFSTSTS